MKFLRLNGKKKVLIQTNKKTMIYARINTKIKMYTQLYGNKQQIHTDTKI